MKIVIVSKNYPPAIGGAEKTTFNLATGLAELGHEVVVVTTGQKGLASQVVREGKLKVLRLGSLPLPVKTKHRLARFNKRVVFDFLDDFAPDVIHFNNISKPCSVALDYGHSHGVPVVGGLHDMPDGYLFFLPSSKLKKYLIKRGWAYFCKFYSRADMVVAPTRTALDYLTRAGLPGSIPMRPISNGVDIKSNQPLPGSLDGVRRELGLEPERSVILYVGRISPEKGIYVLMQAFIKLARGQKKPPYLIFVGRNTIRDRLTKMAAKAGLAGAALLKGFVSEEEKRQIYQACDVFVMASPVELQSIVTLEAMACAKPVVGVDKAALPELIESGVNGELIAEGDDAALAAKLRDLLADPDRRHRYGQAGRRIALTHNIADMPKRHVEVYREAIKRKQS